jgi:hypothetical protein
MGQLRTILAVAFLVISGYFVWRSFYGMRIEEGVHQHASPVSGPTHGAKTD